MEKEQGEHLLPRTSREGLRVPNIRIDDSDPEDYSHYQQPASLTSQTLRWKWAGVTCAAMLASLTLGYVLGHTANLTSEGRSGSGRTQYVDGFPLPPGSVKTTWQHNLTFTQKPTPESEAAWNSIVPVGRGFIHHPELAPFISNIAVFHQLHCLHAIVVAYYIALESEAITDLDKIPDFELSSGTRIASFHIRHCFDYIRQALMCAADTNLEVVDRETHTTNGWGQPKTCRNYEEVIRFAEKYANSSDTGIVTL